MKEVNPIEEFARRCDEVIVGRKINEPKTAVQMLQEEEAKKRHREMFELFFKVQDRGVFEEPGFWFDKLTHEEKIKYWGNK